MKTICRATLILILSWALGLGALYLSYSVVSSSIEHNLESSSQVFIKEGTYPVASKFTPITLDNFTDALMLLISANSSPFSLNKVLLNPNERISVNGKVQNPSQTLSIKFTKDSGNEEKKNIERTYARYWHGYVIWLKPALSVFDYKEIRILLEITLLTISSFFIFSLFRFGLRRYIPAFILFFISLSPSAIFQSLQYSTTIILSLLFSMVIIIAKKKIYSEKNYAYIFLLAGICTCYFDFLTCPILTLGLPATFFILCNEKKSTFETLKFCLFFSIAWAFGYFGMWFGKWLLATIITNQNIFQEAYNQFTIRSSLKVFGGKNFSYLDVFVKNISLFNKSSHNIFYITLLIFLSFATIEALKNNFFLWKNFIKYSYIILLPFIWYSFASNHSFEHFWFTYRNVSLCLFVLLCIMSNFLMHFCALFYSVNKNVANPPVQNLHNNCK